MRAWVECLASGTTLGRAGVVPCLLVALLAVVACGGPGPGPTGPASSASASSAPPASAPASSAGGAVNEACDLVPGPDVQGVLGATPAPQALSAGPFAVIPAATSAECLWRAPDGGQVIVRVVRGPAGSLLGEHIDAVWQAFSDFEPLAGVGDGARIHLDQDLAAHVVAVQGANGVYANYQSVTGDAAAKREAVVTLVADTLASMAS